MKVSHSNACINAMFLALSLTGMGCADLGSLTDGIEIRTDANDSAEAAGSVTAPAVEDAGVGESSGPVASDDQGGDAPEGAGAERASGVSEPDSSSPDGSDVAPDGSAEKPTVPGSSGGGSDPKAPASPVAGTSAAPEAGAEAVRFSMVRPEGIRNAGCVPAAEGEVYVRSEGPVEVMEVSLSGLPAQTEFDLFVTQVPNFPFGISWYQGDMETDAYGAAKVTFVGRFNLEVFALAPDVAPAPQVHEADAAQNAKTGPIHTYHLGLWFGSPEAAAAAGCPDIETPFNGEHNAGVQVLNTGNFPDDAGPLSQL